MKLGVDSYSYHLAIGRYEYRPSKPMSWQEFLERAASLGLEGVQILEFTEEEKRSKSLLKGIRSKADGLSLYIEFGADGTDVKRLTNDLKVAQELRAKIMKTTIESDRYSKTVPRGEQLKAAARRLGEVAPVAENLDIRIAIENHQDLTAPELVSLLEEVNSEYVGICLDTGNSLAVLEDPIYTAETLAPYAYTTHFKDCAFKPSPYGTKICHAGLGRGILPLPRIFGIIKAKAPDPNINIEVVSEPRWTEEETLIYEHQTVLDSIEYAKKVFGL